MKRKADAQRTSKAVKRRKTKPSNLAFQANTLRKGPEKKNNDIDNWTVAIATALGGTWNLTSANSLLNGIAQGNSEVTRIGRKISMVNLGISWTASLAATTTQGCSFRFKVIYDKQTNGTLPVVTDVLTINTFASPMNLNNADRFTVLHDEIINNISVQNNFSVSGKCFIKMDLEAVYNAAGAGVGQINTGGLYLMFCNSATAATTAPTFAYYSRLRYLDQ